MSYIKTILIVIGLFVVIILFFLLGAMLFGLLFMKALVVGVAIFAVLAVTHDLLKNYKD